MAEFHDKIASRICKITAVQEITHIIIRVQPERELFFTRVVRVLERDSTENGMRNGVR